MSDGSDDDDEDEDDTLNRFLQVRLSLERTGFLLKSLEEGEARQEVGSDLGAGGASSSSLFTDLFPHQETSQFHFFFCDDSEFILVLMYSVFP